MASGKGHIWGGLIFAIIFIYTITNYFYKPSLLEVIIYIALACMFSVWPDIDIKSFGQKFFYSIFLITDIFKNGNCFLIFLANIIFVRLAEDNPKL